MNKLVGILKFIFLQRKMQSDCNLWCIVLKEDNASVKSNGDKKNNQLGIPNVGKGHLLVMNGQ